MLTLLSVLATLTIAQPPASVSAQLAAVHVTDITTLTAARMVQGSTLATYTAAGHVRRALTAAGLEVERAQGYGRKRHMTKACKP